jgi:hypothetical protein
MRIRRGARIRRRRDRRRRRNEGIATVVMLFEWVNVQTARSEGGRRWFLCMNDGWRKCLNWFVQAMGGQT